MRRQEKYQTRLQVPAQIEAVTFLHWVACGALTVITQGDENTYGVTEFGQEYFAKLEAQHEMCGDCLGQRVKGSAYHCES